MWNQVEQALNQSATSVLTGLARLLPGTIALILALLLAALIGWLVGSLLARVLRSVEFDQWVRSLGRDFGDWSGMGSPTLLVVRIATWTVIFLGFLIGLAAFDPTLTSELALRLFGSALDLFIAAALLVVGSIFARFISRGVLISLVIMNVHQARLLSLGVKWLVVIFFAAMALDHLGVGGTIVKLAFGILFGGIVLALALTVALRSKDLADWSLARQAEKTGDDSAPPPVQHL
jgi:hypothetical protein